MQSESDRERNPENVSEPYSLSKLKIKKWIKPTKKTQGLKMNYNGWWI